MNGWVSILLPCLIVIVICGVIVLIIHHKMKDFSQSVFDNDSIIDGLKEAESAYLATPKSVSAMTSLCLPNIVKDFPDFNYDEMKERAQRTLLTYLESISMRNATILSEGNEELRNKLSVHIQHLIEEGMVERFANCKINRTEISRYTKKEGRCIVTFQTSIGYQKSGTTDSKIRTNDSLIQTRYCIDLIYIQDRGLVQEYVEGAMGLNCPNCGAPLTSLGTKQCPYCGTPVVEINIHAWSFSDIREE